ncbi:MAG TPA: hypothetical protein P5319_03900 [Gemmatimonadales bacterium]|nr:hypothetical protein [Gemmatimonadales bacterium]
MSFRSLALLAAVLSMAPLGLLAAQQTAAPVTTTSTPAGPAAEAAGAPADVVTPSPSVPKPQYSPLYLKSDSVPTLGTNDRAMAAEGKSHTIVLSTLALILVVVILVLLIA